jgi:hypothetical protein
MPGDSLMQAPQHAQAQLVVDGAGPVGEWSACSRASGWGCPRPDVLAQSTVFPPRAHFCLSGKSGSSLVAPRVRPAVLKSHKRVRMTLPTDEPRPVSVSTGGAGGASSSVALPIGVPQVGYAEGRLDGLPGHRKGPRVRGEREPKSTRAERLRIVQSSTASLGKVRRCRGSGDMIDCAVACATPPPPIPPAAPTLSVTTLQFDPLRRGEPKRAADPRRTKRLPNEVSPAEERARQHGILRKVLGGGGGEGEGAGAGGVVSKSASSAAAFTAKKAALLPAAPAAGAGGRKGGKKAAAAGGFKGRKDGYRGGKGGPSFHKAGKSSKNHNSGDRAAAGKRKRGA